VTANPALTTGTGRGNAVVSPQPGMTIQPTVIADASGNLASVTSSGAITANQGLPNTTVNRWPVQITDGTSLVSVVANNSGNNAELNVSTGFTVAAVTLNAVTANTVGTAIDAGAAQSNWSAVATATGSPTAGVLTLEVSLDGTAWAASGATSSIPAAGTYLISLVGTVARYARVSLTNLSGTVTLTVKMMAAG
jgi:hypothetical protein